MKNKSIVLIGMAGVGKSTTGKLLAESLGWEFTDLDKDLITEKGKSTQQIIEDEGEQAFLEFEKKRMFELDLNHRVASPGGSIIYHSDLMKYLKENAVLVYLCDSVENIAERVRKRGSRGIVGLNNKSFAEVFKERLPLYERHADVTIFVEGKLPQDIVKEISHILMEDDLI